MAESKRWDVYAWLGDDSGWSPYAGTIFERGDVNCDGEVRISDVTALINYLLSGDATGIILEAADCNADGQVKIADVTALINYLLRGTWPDGSAKAPTMTTHETPSAHSPFELPEPDLEKPVFKRL